MVPSPDATPPPPPIATTPQFSSSGLTVFQWGCAELAEGSQESVLPAPSMPVEIRVRVELCPETSAR